MRARRWDIDAAKGLAILLVVFGHLVARTDPRHVSWYEPLRQAVYAFHMPFFLYLSGLVAVESGLLRTPPEQWRRVAAARARRLLLPFFGLGGLVVAGKLALARFIAVDHPPPSLGAGLANLLWHTAASPALSLWYLFVLFVVSLASMAVLSPRPARLPWLLLAALLLYAVPLPAYFYADRIGRYAIFFLLGVWAGAMGESWLALLRRLWRPALGVLLAALAVLIGYGRDWPPALVMLCLGPLSCAGLHGFLRQLPDMWLRGSLLFLGRYSFMIYLGNTACIGLAKGVLLRALPWDGAHFYLFAAVLMAAGIGGPVALKRGVCARFPALDRLTD